MENEIAPVFSHAEPVLAVRDVKATIAYWQEVLCFPNTWTAGDPPDHAGVSRNGAFVQFSLNPELAETSKGNSIWIRVNRIEALYALHREKGADVVATLQNMPYGFAEYTVRDINGYYISFAASASDREKNRDSIPGSFEIIPRAPTVAEHIGLAKSVGWGVWDDLAGLEARLASVVFGATAVEAETGNAIGCALLTTDGMEFYYVRDVIVHPDWQGRRVGAGLMQVMSDWINANLTNSAFVALITREQLEPFYQPFGFEKAFSMIKIRR